jgi:hypothetical protein
MGGLRSTPCEESCHRFSVITIKKTIDRTNANYYRKNSYSQDASNAMLSWGIHCDHWFHGVCVKAIL